MGRPSRYSPEVRERSVRMVLDQMGQHNSQWAAIQSVSSKIGCTAETLRRWVRQAEYDAGVRDGLTTEERVRLKQLDRENRELKRTNEILRKASAYFAQAELDRRKHFRYRRVITIAGIGDQDPRNRRSASSGITDHDGPEYARCTPAVSR